MERLTQPHVARHTAATTLLEATDGDVASCQEVSDSHPGNVPDLHEITDRRKRDAYIRLQAYMHDVAVRIDG